jgi:chromosome condensin MukBEF ATPase and DNA-binding subunit MukB
MEKKMSKKEREKIEDEFEIERKEWDELTDSQKIERTRNFVKKELSWINNKLSELNKKVRKLEKHYHLKGGKIVTEIDFNDRSGEVEVYLGKNYF